MAVVDVILLVIGIISLMTIGLVRLPNGRWTELELSRIYGIASEMWFVLALALVFVKMPAIDPRSPESGLGLFVLAVLLFWASGVAGDRATRHLKKVVQ